MTQTPDEPEALRAVRARTKLVQTVRTRLKGSGLDIRELASHLAISQPGQPEHGRIYISYATGEASLRHCTWHYLGPLDGYGSDDPDADPSLSTEQIIATLTGRADRPT
jgi:hypothetical protein